MKISIPVCYSILFFKIIFCLLVLKYISFFAINVTVDHKPEVDHKPDLCSRCINYLLLSFTFYDLASKLKGTKVNGMND